MTTSLRTRLSRAVAATSLTLVAGLTLAGCMSTSAEPSAPVGIAPPLRDDQHVDITFESYNLAQAGLWTDTVNQLIDEFESEHPNITVTGQAPQGSSSGNTATVSSVQKQLLGGDPPDVAQLTFDTFDFTANQLGAKPLSDLVSKEELAEAVGGEHPIHPNALALTQWNGETVGMPYVFSTPVMFYNEDALADAGITDPDFSTWESTQKIAEKVSARTGKPSLDVPCVSTGGNWCMQGLFRSNGARVLSEDRSTIEFDSPEAVDTVDRFAGLFTDGVLRNADAATSQEGLGKGDVQMVLTTSALQGSMMKAADSAGWTLKAAPMPAFAGKTAVPTNSGSGLYVFSDDAAKQRASWEFIRFMTSDRAYEVISSQIGYLPLRSGLVDDGQPLHQWMVDNPLVEPNLEQLDHMQPWVSYPGNSYAQVDTLLADAIEQSVYYGADTTSTLQRAADRAQKLID